MKTLKIQKILAPALVAGGMAVSGAVLAATSTANMTVKINISGTCSMNNTVPEMLFAPQTGGWSGNVDKMVAVAVTCTNGHAYKVGADNGINAQGTQRRMKNTLSNEYVSYQIYTDNTYADVLNDTFTGAGSKVISQSGTGLSQSINLYGRVPAVASPIVGAYADTVKITLSY